MIGHDTFWTRWFSEFERNVSAFKLGPHSTLSGQRSLIPSLRVSLLYQTKNFHLLDSDNQEVLFDSHVTHVHISFLAAIYRPT